MTEPTFDAFGYPTEETLERIRTWPTPTFADMHAAMDFAGRAWRSPEYWERTVERVGALRPQIVYTFSTGGWSGNESIVSAIEANVMLRRVVVETGRPLRVPLPRRSRGTIMTDRWDDLDRAAEAATPGPWQSKDLGRGSGASAFGCYVVDAVESGYPGAMLEGLRSEADARYVAHADPSTIRELIADNRRLREALAGAVTVLGALRFNGQPIPTLVEWRRLVAFGDDR